MNLLHYSMNAAYLAFYLVGAVEDVVKLVSLSLTTEYANNANTRDVS